MADAYRKISDFSVAGSFGDEDLLLVSQSGATRVVTGAMLKELAKAAGVEAAKINSAEVNATGNLILRTTDGVQIDVGKVTGSDGVSVTGASIDAKYHLILTLSDGKTLDAGYCRGASGAGAGDMQQEEYDADGTVKAAGGIAAFALPETVVATLSVSGWSDGQQTANNAALLAAGYQYLVSPSYDSVEAYNAAGVLAKDVETDGSMTFTCGTVPTAELTVQILKVRVQ